MIRTKKELQKEFELRLREQRNIACFGFRENLENLLLDTKSISNLCLKLEDYLESIFEAKEKNDIKELKRKLELEKNKRKKKKKKPEEEQEESKDDGDGDEEGKEEGEDSKDKESTKKENPIKKMIAASLSATKKAVLISAKKTASYASRKKNSIEIYTGTLEDRSGLSFDEKLTNARIIYFAETIDKKKSSELIAFVKDKRKDYDLIIEGIIGSLSQEDMLDFPDTDFSSFIRFYDFLQKNAQSPKKAKAIIGKKDINSLQEYFNKQFNELKDKLVEYNSDINDSVIVGYADNIKKKNKMAIRDIRKAVSEIEKESRALSKKAQHTIEKIDLLSHS
mgnify:CR=1 FL=1